MKVFGWCFPCILFLWRILNMLVFNIVVVYTIKILHGAKWNFSQISFVQSNQARCLLEGSYVRVVAFTRFIWQEPLFYWNFNLNVHSKHAKQQLWNVFDVSFLLAEPLRHLWVSWPVAILNIQNGKKEKSETNRGDLLCDMLLCCLLTLLIMHLKS